MSELLPLPAVRFAAPLQPSQVCGAKGELTWIAIEKLFVDKSYQRDVKGSGERNIRRIVEQFNWSRFSPLVVARRGENRFAVIDGQHRAIAAKMHGAVRALPCLVVHADAAGEALAFAVINGSVTKLATHYLFRARLAGGECSAAAANDAATAAGVRIMPYPVQASELKANETLASGTIEKAVARWNVALVADALKIIMGAAKGEAGHLRAATILGLCQALAHRPAVRTELPRLIGIFARYTLTRLFEEGRSGDRYDTGIRGSARTAIARIALRLIAAEFGRAAPDDASAAAEAKPRTPVPKAKRVVVPTERPERSPSRTAPRGNFEFGKPPSRPSSPKTAEDEKAAIAAFIAKNGVRKLEGTATGNTSNLLDWLNNVCKIPACRASTGKGSTKYPYEVEGKRLDLDGLLDVVDRERKKRGLEPIRRKAA